MRFRHPHAKTKNTRGLIKHGNFRVWGLNENQGAQRRVSRSLLLALMYLSYSIHLAERSNETIYHRQKKAVILLVF